LDSGVFFPIEFNEIGYSNCSSNYYVFQTSDPFLPIKNEQGEATCLLNNDNITASWSITKPCEPSCVIRSCDHNQVCAKPTGENIEKCICAGYIGKYCESIDASGNFFFYFIFFFFS